MIWVVLIENDLSSTFRIYRLVELLKNWVWENQLWCRVLSIVINWKLAIIN